MSWSDMDPDDRMGYLQDFVISYAKEHNIQNPQDVWKQDLASTEFMIEILEACGVFENE